MSSTTSVTPTHLTYKKVTAKNAKCDICNTRNVGVMQKCVTCGVTTCQGCDDVGRYDSKHNLANLSLDWTKPNPNGKGVRAAVRGNKTVILTESSDDDSLFVPQAPRAPRAPGTSRREGLIRERATMTAACNVRRARDDQANQRQAGLAAQLQNQDHPSTHNSVVGDGDDDDVMEVPAPTSLDQFTSDIRQAEANVTQHLRDENEVLLKEVQRLRDKERSRAEEDRRLREQLQQQKYLAEEARVAYHREIASHRQTIEELSEIRKDHDDDDDCKEQLTNWSSEALPGKDAAMLKLGEPRPVATSSTPSTGATGSTTGIQTSSLRFSDLPAVKEAGSTTGMQTSSLRFSDLPAIKEAQPNQLNADMFYKDGVLAPPPVRIPRNPFQSKRRKQRAAQATATEDEDTLMEDASSDDTLSSASADTTKETPVTTKGQASADNTENQSSPSAASQASSSTMTASGTQTELSAATYAGKCSSIAEDMRATAFRAIFGPERFLVAPLLQMRPPDFDAATATATDDDGSGSGSGSSSSIDGERVLAAVRRKWERSVSFHQIKAEQGSLAALDTLETSTSLGCLSLGVPFPPQVDTYIQRTRESLRREQGGGGGGGGGETRDIAN